MGGDTVYTIYNTTWKSWKSWKGAGPKHEVMNVFFLLLSSLRFEACEICTSIKSIMCHAMCVWYRRRHASCPLGRRATAVTRGLIICLWALETGRGRACVYHVRLYISSSVVETRRLNSCRASCTGAGPVAGELPACGPRGVRAADSCHREGQAGTC